MPSQPHISPKNTIITFDLHGVIFTPDYRRLARVLWNCTGKVWLILNLFHPRVIWCGFVMLFKRSAAEKYIMRLAEINPRLKPYVQLGIDLSNCQKPIPETLAIIKELKQQGYTLHILSNLGALSLEQLKPRFPDVFSHFQAIRVTMPKDDYLNKPNIGIFRDYLACHNPHNKHILLIDDGRQNIQAAQDIGFSTIYFRSPNQLQQELKKRKVL